MAHWSPGENVAVLGAGATRGSLWVDRMSACLFHQALRLSR